MRHVVTRTLFLFTSSRLGRMKATSPAQQVNAQPTVLPCIDTVLPCTDTMQGLSVAMQQKMETTDCPTAVKWCESVD